MLHSAGRGPVKRLCIKLIFSRLGAWPHSVGSVPDKELALNSMILTLDKAVHSVGSVPVSWLPNKNKPRRLDIALHSDGSGPSREFCSNARYVMSPRTPIAAGRVPLSPHENRTRCLTTCLLLPGEDGPQSTRVVFRYPGIKYFG